MIYGVLIFTIVALVVLCAWLVYKVKVLNKAVEQTANTFVKMKNPPMTIGIVTRYKDAELEILKANPEVLDLLIKIFEYKIAVSTDSIRRNADTEKTIGFVNCLHETHLFFWKLREELKEKEKIGQNLV